MNQCKMFGSVRRRAEERRRVRDSDTDYNDSDDTDGMYEMEINLNIFHPLKF